MLSIIIPVYNQPEMTRMCLEAVIKHTRDYEIIVVDNGSKEPFTPPAQRWVEVTEFGDIDRYYMGDEPGVGALRVIRNEENEGFPAAVNQGIRAVENEIIVLLNNDVIVTPGSLNRLEQYVKGGRISIVSPLTNYAAGMQCVTIGAYENDDGLNYEAKKLSEENAGKIAEVNFVIGFCMVFKKSLYEELGAFDESLWPCSGEEIDFCFRAREAGHKIGIAHDVYLHHFGSKTFEDMGNAGIINYMEVVNRNDAHLAKKWGADFWQRQAII